MIIFCNLFIYLSELIISVIYFNSSFETKRKKAVIFSAFAISFVLQYIAHHIDSDLSLIINLSTFFVCNFVILCTCYKVNFLQALFNVVLLEGIMLTTELVIMYAVSAITNVELLQFETNPITLFIDSTATKVLYFFVAMLIAKIRNKRRSKDNSNDFAMILFVLPFLSVFIIIIIGKVMAETQLSETTYWLFALISALMMVANFIVFLVHEKVVSTLTQNTELQLEKQKMQISDDYYQTLEKQYNQSSILVHDIKKHLSTMSHIAEEEKCERINEYITLINDEYEIRNFKRYTTNKLLNVILNRYSNMCNEKGVNLFTEIRDVDISFISDGDLTVIIDNLLENAYEATTKSIEKNIVFDIHMTNEKFVVLQISNSCDKNPEIINGTIKTSKADKTSHGYGLRSVRRAVSKYNGDIDFTYNNNEKMFYVTIVISK